MTDEGETRYLFPLCIQLWLVSPENFRVLDKYSEETKFERVQRGDVGPISSRRKCFVFRGVLTRT